MTQITQPNVTYVTVSRTRARACTRAFFFAGAHAYAHTPAHAHAHTRALCARAHAHTPAHVLLKYLSTLPLPLPPPLPPLGGRGGEGELRARVSRKELLNGAEWHRQVPFSAV